MRILRIKNYEKYQTHKTKNPTWIKLYRDLLIDREFLKLDVKCRYLFVCCLIIASETFNRCINDVAYLSQRCFTDVSQDDINRLIRSGLIVASRSTKWRSEKRERREETERETDTHRVQPERSLPLSDDEWLISMRSNPAYKHLDLDQELGKMDAWLSTRPQKKRTRRFIVNWLNRVEKPMNGNAYRAPVARTLAIVEDKHFQPTIGKEEAESILKRLVPSVGKL